MNQGGGILDDMMGDLSGPGEEEIEEGEEDLQEKARKGREKYEKEKGKKEEPRKPKEGKTGEKGKGLGQGGKEAGKAGADAAKTGAKAGAQAAKAGAQAAGTAAKAGAQAAATTGAAAGAGAATAGIGAAVVLAAAAAKKAGSWAWKHRKTLLIILLFIIFVELFIVMVGIGELGYSFSGGYGKSPLQKAGTNSTNVKNVLSDATQEANSGPPDSPYNNPVIGYNQIVFKDQKDKQFIQDGKIDDRLARALAYISKKHGMIRISHIISDYEYMNAYEAGQETNSQVIKNITAHKDGLAADLDMIDFVYKVFETNTECAAASNGLAGDIVYYNDLDEELLRLKCRGDIFDTAQTNTLWRNLPAQALPIKILYQDTKPNIEHAGNETDPCPDSLTNPEDRLVCDQVYRPEARRKVHQALGELLQFPYDTENLTFYRITQLITYSEERDVLPFAEDGTLDQLYGVPREANFGLFAMLEAWQNIHLGY